MDDFNSEMVDSAEVSVEYPREHTLELMVRSGRLVEVAWDRQVIFTKEPEERQISSRDYIGAFGIRYAGHRTEIRHPRVMFYPRELQ
jgi:hypothetical protein